MKNDKKILIIEPDGIVGLDLKLELEKEKFSVSNPNSIADAEFIIANNKPDLIIANTDIKKETFFEKIKIQIKKCQLPFIWVGTLTKSEVAIESEGINVVGFFSKPFNSKSVVALIINYFNKIKNLIHI